MFTLGSLEIPILFSLGVTADALRANIDCKSPFFEGVGHFGPKFQVSGTTPPTVLRVRKLDASTFHRD